MNLLKKEYGEVGLFFRTSLRKYIWIATVFFLLTAVLTYFVACSNPKASESVARYFVAIMTEKGIDLNNEKTLGLTLICNNLIASGYSMVLGIVPFLFLPVWTLALNGAVLGFLGGFTQTVGMSFGVYMAGILPHGVFELPAFVISASLGMYLCAAVVQSLLRMKGARPFGETAMDILRSFLLTVLPLVLIAGLVEAYITPVLLNALINP